MVSKPIEFQIDITNALIKLLKEIAYAKKEEVVQKLSKIIRDI